MNIDANNKTSFGMKIKINKSLHGCKFPTSANEASKVYGSATLSTGIASGTDMFVHAAGNNLPEAVVNSSVLNDIREFGHVLLNILNKGGGHNAYDASFFSSVNSSLGSKLYKSGAQDFVNSTKSSKNIPT